VGSAVLACFDGCGLVISHVISEYGLEMIRVNVGEDFVSVDVTLLDVERSSHRHPDFVLCEIDCHRASLLGSRAASAGPS
jgi:hypothetical protein